MAADFVQHTGDVINGSGTSTVDIPVTNAPTIGNLLVLCGALDSTSNDISSVSDDGGNDWQQDRAVAGNGKEEPLAWSAPVTGIPSTITVTLISNSSQKCLTVDEYTGVDLTASRLVSAAKVDAVGTGSAETVTSGDPGAAGEFLAVGVLAWKGGTAGNAPNFTDSTFTAASDKKKGSGQHNAVHMSYKVLATADPTTFSGSFDAAPASPGWCACVLVYKAASAGSAVALDLGAIPTSAATHGVDLSATRVLALGALPSPGGPAGLGLSAVRGLALGAIPSSAAVHGLDLGRSIGLQLGAIPPGAAVHGLDLARFTTVDLGAIASPSSVHGVDLAATRRLLLGHIPSAAQLHGLDIASGVLHGRYTVLVEMYDEGIMVPIADPALLVHLAQPDLRVSL